MTDCDCVLVEGNLFALFCIIGTDLMCGIWPFVFELPSASLPFGKESSESLAIYNVSLMWKVIIYWKLLVIRMPIWDDRPKTNPQRIIRISYTQVFEESTRLNRYMKIFERKEKQRFYIMKMFSVSPTEFLAYNDFNRLRGKRLKCATMWSFNLGC